MSSKTPVVYLMVIFLLFNGRHLCDARNRVNDTCSLSIWPRSISFFDSELARNSPHFVHFRLEFDRNVSYNTTSNVFKPLNWVWTFKSHYANYPYTSWNIDYGLLSFGLLESYTLDIDFVKINGHGNCSLTLGEYDTSMLIASALTDLVKNLSDGIYNVYDSNEFCYLSFDEDVNETWSYFAAKYFYFPLIYFGYKCCHVTHNYTSNDYNHFCDKDMQTKWEQSTFLPYGLGMFLFMYCPIAVFQVCAWLVKDDSNTRHVELHTFSINGEDYQDIDNQNGKWIFLNGDTPIGVTHLIQYILCNMGNRHPVAMSRIRRAICILLTPSIIYIQLAMYSKGIGIPESKISVSDLVKRGVPMGFLSLLGEKEHRNKAFAPAFGGAFCLLMMFHLLSFIFAVIPRSLNLVVERSMHVRNLPSPLFFDADEIISMSMCRIYPAPGYEKAYAVCKCSIYMLFTRNFWRKVFDIQLHRFSPFLKFTQKCKIIKYLILPFYIFVCFLEIVVCLVFYGIPIFGSVTIMIKGCLKSMSRIRNIMTVFDNPISVVFGFVFFICFLFCVYSICLIFIGSFSFVCQIITFCFIAVIVYPSIAFSSLFFCVVMLYYIVHLMKDFGDGYLGLLSVAVEKSQDLFMHMTNTAIFNGELIISNFSLQTVNAIRINDIRIDISENILHNIKRVSGTEKIRKVNNVYGIPVSLFDYLVKEHRPFHIQILKLVFHLVAVGFLIAATLGITSKVATGKTNEMSEVMHVIFIVTIGALPRILEIAMMNARESVLRDVKEREIECSIIEYWIKENAYTPLNNVDTTL